MVGIDKFAIVFKSTEDGRPSATALEWSESVVEFQRLARFIKFAPQTVPPLITRTHSIFTTTTTTATSMKAFRGHIIVALIA